MHHLRILKMQFYNKMHRMQKHISHIVKIAHTNLAAFQNTLLNLKSNFNQLLNKKIHEENPHGIFASFDDFIQKIKYFALTSSMARLRRQPSSCDCRSGTSRFSRLWKIYSPHNSRRVLTKIAKRQKYFRYGKTEKGDPTRGGLTTRGTTMNILLSCSQRVVIHTRPTYTHCRPKSGLCRSRPGNTMGQFLDHGAVLCVPYCANRSPA